MVPYGAAETDGVLEGRSPGDGLMFRNRALTG